MESDAFSGAEIEQAILDGMYEAFFDGKREVTTNDIVHAIKSSVPLAITAKDEVDKLRKWALTDRRARPASTIVDPLTAAQSQRRRITRE